MRTYKIFLISAIENTSKMGKGQILVSAPNLFSTQKNKINDLHIKPKRH